VTAVTAVTARTARIAAAQMPSPIVRLRRLSHTADTFRLMRALAGLCVAIFLLSVAAAAIAVTVAIQMVVELLPVVVCAALIVGAIRARSRSGRRGLPGASTPDVTPGYRYTQHQWGWARTPLGGWAWVSVWIAQPPKAADVIDAELISEKHDRD
jgi:hypothetical protein